MENFYLSAIISEMSPKLVGRSISKISLSGSDLLIDFRLPEGLILLASLDPSCPALYLAARHQKTTVTDSSHPFVSLLRKAITGAKLISISKHPRDRIARFDFEKFDAGGDKARNSLILALTGRSSNAYLTNSENRIEAMLRERGGPDPGERIDLNTDEFNPSEIIQELDEDSALKEVLEKFFGPQSPFGPLLKKEFIARSTNQSPASAFESLTRNLFHKEPLPMVYSRLPLEETGDNLITPKSDLLLSHIELAQAEGLIRFEFPSLSEAADQYHQALRRAKAFQNEIGALKRILNEKIKKQETLKRGLQAELERFEDPERLKQWGNLLLANLATARVEENTAKVVDYYDPDQPLIEIEIEEGHTLQQAASKYFNRYQKARRALAAIEPRLTETCRLLNSLTEILRDLEETPTALRLDEARDRTERLLKIKPGKESGKSSRGKPKKKSGKEIGRWFISSDGYEIGVGKNDRDNDSLTFRVARPQDIWMHAADYPGSHLIVRNPRREEIPQRAIFEAAQIAAFYSQARQQSKVAVHYTQKKFVSKPPKSKPGLVRLSSFKTILVEPACKIDRTD